ncbi:ferrous iron transport protein A [Propionibacterium freudenreichii]|nr:FeoA family protein [Propionibacterium freudenreichii]WFF32554.1 ferrous iron transport protein A [Propionibacterium freudenreichii]
MSARVVPDEFTAETTQAVASFETVGSKIVPLSNLHAGDVGVICRLDEEADESITHRLQLLGFDCGREVCLIRQAPLSGPMVFRVCDAQMCLREAQADMIYVRIPDDAAQVVADAEASVA